MAATTLVTPASRTAGAHGPVRPKWLHGSRVMYSVAFRARSPARARAMASACGVPGPSCQPSPITSPSLTSTAPTIGLGEARPRPRRARARALRMNESSASAVTHEPPWGQGRGRVERPETALGKSGHPSCSSSPIPTFTVGPGVSPGQPSSGTRGVADSHRRWGIAPRPEDELAWSSNPSIRGGTASAVSTCRAGQGVAARRSTAKEEPALRLANCFISVATATASP